MAGVTGISDLESVADGLDDVASRNGPHSHRTVVENTVDRLFSTEVLQQVRARAQQHVGERTRRIGDQSLGWAGSQYRHAIESNDEVVAAHERGTGIHGAGGGAYRIPSSETDGPIVIDTAGGPQVVEYAIHPGVEQKRFIERTVQQQADDVADDIGDEIADAIRDAI